MLDTGMNRRYTASKMYWIYLRYQEGIRSSRAQRSLGSKYKKFVYDLKITKFNYESGRDKVKEYINRA